MLACGAKNGEGTVDLQGLHESSGGVQGRFHLGFEGLGDGVPDGLQVGSGGVRAGTEVLQFSRTRHGVLAMACHCRCKRGRRRLPLLLSGETDTELRTSVAVLPVQRHRLLEPIARHLQVAPSESDYPGQGEGVRPVQGP